MIVRQSVSAEAAKFTEDFNDVSDGDSAVYSGTGVPATATVDAMISGAHATATYEDTQVGPRFDLVAMFEESRLGDAGTYASAGGFVFFEVTTPSRYEVSGEFHAIHVDQPGLVDFGAGLRNDVDNLNPFLSEFYTYKIRVPPNLLTSFLVARRVTMTTRGSLAVCPAYYSQDTSTFTLLSEAL